MIYILEIPHRLTPRVWCRESKDEIIDVIELGEKCWTIYEAKTGQEFLDGFGHDSTEDMRQASQDEYDGEIDPTLIDLASLIDKHGLDTTYYTQAGQGYQVEPIDKFDAYINWNARDLQSQRVYMSTEEAIVVIVDGDESLPTEAQYALELFMEDNSLLPSDEEE